VTAPAEPVGIIGAGPAGLAAADALERAGVAYEVLERHDATGGIWDIENPGTPMYESAHFISSKTLSGFEGHPFPDDYPDYPNREQVLAYIRSFAADRGLEPHIRFGAEVERAERSDDGGWEVSLADGETRRYSHLVAATGHQWEPRIPDYPGEFVGEELHSREYRSPDLFRGRRVLIVGAGNSGCDIACDAAANASHAALSVRRGYWFYPKHLFGKPADVFAHGGPHLPLRVEQAMLTLTLKLLVGDVTKYGLPKPDHRVLESHPIMNTQVLHYMGHGDLVARPDVRSLRAEGVTFADGTEEDFDLIVWATGYEVSLPFLDRGEFEWSGTRPDLFLNQFHRRHEDLSVMGLFEVDAGAFPVLSLQGELLARSIEAERGRPELAAQFRELKATRPDLSGGTRHVDSPRHDISIQDAAYQRYARKLLEGLRSGRLRKRALR
jgi:cation diffusion facilitator CzcD-associated flavoprotein CzcO